MVRERLQALFVHMADVLAMAAEARQAGVAADEVDVGGLVRSAQELSDPNLPSEDVTDQAQVEASQEGQKVIEARERRVIGADSQEDLAEIERLREGRRNK